MKNKLSRTYAVPAAATASTVYWIHWFSGTLASRPSKIGVFFSLVPGLKFTDPITAPAAFTNDRVMFVKFCLPRIESLVGVYAHTDPSNCCPGEAGTFWKAPDALEPPRNGPKVFKSRLPSWGPPAPAGHTRGDVQAAEGGCPVSGKELLKIVQPPVPLAIGGVNVSKLPSANRLLL